MGKAVRKSLGTGGSASRMGIRTVGDHEPTAAELADLGPRARELRDRARLSTGVRKRLSRYCPDVSGDPSACHQRQKRCVWQSSRQGPQRRGRPLRAHKGVLVCLPLQPLGVELVTVRASATDVRCTTSRCRYVKNRDSPLESRGRCPPIELETRRTSGRKVRPMPFALAALHDHGDLEAWIDVIFGSLEGEAVHDERVTFGCRVGPVQGSDQPAATAVQAAQPYDESPTFGHKLSRAEALEHPRVHDFWRVVDFLLEREPAINHHVYAHLPDRSTGPRWRRRRPRVASVASHQRPERIARQRRVGR